MLFGLFSQIFGVKDWEGHTCMERYIGGTHWSTKVTLGICLPSMSYEAKCKWMENVHPKQLFILELFEALGLTSK